MLGVRTFERRGSEEWSKKLFLQKSCLKMLSKREMLKKIEEDCRRANLPLKESAINLVFGKGNPEADIMFVGEAAGHSEDEQGLPFVGAAGKNLDKLLQRVGLTMDDVYIANILKYRPPENRNPLPDEIKAHTPWLIEQIKQIKPKIICSLGNYATKFFLAGGNVEDMEKMPGITQVHGKIRMMDFLGLKIKLIPLFHPAAIIYKRELTESWEKDMEIVKEEIKQKTL
jgi:DNA polymerase